MNLSLLAVQEVKDVLLASGFKELSETEPWSIKPLDKVKHFSTNIIQIQDYMQY